MKNKTWIIAELCDQKATHDSQTNPSGLHYAIWKCLTASMEKSMHWFPIQLCLYFKKKIILLLFYEKIHLVYIVLKFEFKLSKIIYNLIQ